METRLHLIVVWFHWKLRTKKDGNCSGRSRVRRILLTRIQLLLLQFLHVIWSMPTNFALFEKINFFIHLRIPRLIVNRYTLQVSRTLKRQPAKQVLGSSGQKRERARARETREGWGSYLSPRVSPSRAPVRPFFLVPTTSKRLLRRPLQTGKAFQ